MSPTNPGVFTQLRNLVYYNLDNNLLRNALFIAGRLHALEPRSMEAAYLLSLCHLRSGELKAAYDFSKLAGSRGTHLGCAYVLAQACLALEIYPEGINALERSKELWEKKNSWNKHNESKRQHTPDAPAVYCLMGKLYQANDESTRAVDCYAAALKMNPFMWDAFQALCDMGASVRIPNIFKMTPEMAGGEVLIYDDAAALPTIDDSPPLNVAQNPPTNIKYDPFNSVSVPQGGQFLKNGKQPLYEKLNGSQNSLTPVPNMYDQHGNDSFETPPGMNIPPVGSSRDPRVLDESAAPEPPLAPARKSRIVAGFSAEGTSAVPARTRTGGMLSRPQSASELDEGETAAPPWNLPTGIADRKRTASGHVSKASVASTRNNASLGMDIGGAAPQRRSARLFNSVKPQPKASETGSVHRSLTSGKDSGREVKKIKATGAKSTATRQTAGRVVSGNRRIGDSMEVDAKEARAIVPSGAPAPVSRTTQSERVKDQESVRQLLELFRSLGSGYFALSHYRNQEAVNIFGSLSSTQRDTPWVLAMMGRAFFEQGKYAEAERQFERSLAMCPSRLDDLEVYSTALWHNRAEVRLAYLAHQATDQDRLSPQAWCVVGNSLSLERNHEKALVAFTRATQLDPKFAYGYTLQGHEYVSTEEYDKALSAFRTGITADPRHYQGYYGIGKVFEKQGKYEDAERHYKIALSINPMHAVLVLCLGGVYEKMKRPQQALEQYTKSCQLAPKSTLSRFKLARLLMVMNHVEEAHAELMVLKDSAPEEANVQFLLGRVYKAMGRKGDAIRHFTAALNLDPKASHHIKEAMEEMEDHDMSDLD